MAPTHPHGNPSSRASRSSRFSWRRLLSHFHRRPTAHATSADGYGEGYAGSGLAGEAHPERTSAFGVPAVTPDARGFRRWQLSLLAVTSCGLFGLAWLALNHQEKATPKPVVRQTQRFSLTANADRESFYTRFDARVTALNRQVDVLTTTLEKERSEKAALSKQLDQLSGAITTLTNKTESEATAREAWQKSMEGRLTAPVNSAANPESDATQPDSARAKLQAELGVLPNTNPNAAQRFAGSSRNANTNTYAYGGTAGSADYRFTERGGYVSPAQGLPGQGAGNMNSAANAGAAASAGGHLTELRLMDAEQAGSAGNLRMTGATATHNGSTVAQARANTAPAQRRGPAFGPTPYLLPDTPLALNRAMGVDGYIAAGSFAPATLLIGAYVMTGASASNMPIPVLLRLVDSAILPNQFQANVRGCFLTGAATGDLSSERILVRLDRLSCTREDGSQLDVSVKGYVVGEDGKVGMRGKLITRSGQAIASALSIGVLSGFGDAITLTSQSTTTSSLGFQTTEVRDAWRHGLRKGISGAMDRIVDYYLKIADQIFPVLEYASGRQVDVVFSQGVLLKDPRDAGSSSENATTEGATPQASAEAYRTANTLPMR